MQRPDAGAIPVSIGNLVNLTELNLSRNGLSGEFMLAQFYTKNAISPQQQKQTESRRPLASQLPKMRSNSSCPTAALSWSERLRERHRSARCFTMARLQNANISHRTLCTPMATTPPSADTAPRAPNTDCFLGAGVILNRALTSNHHPPPLHL